MTNNLPQGWVECILGDVLYLQNGYAFNSKDYSETGINIIRISDIQDNKVTTEKSVKYNKKDIDKCFHIVKGDFLLAMSGATTGKTGTYTSDEISYLNQRVGNLKIYSEEVLLPQYRNYFIANKRKEIERKAYGGAQPNISKQLIESLNLLLPPLKEQKRIVEKIENEFEKIDEGIEKLKLVQEQVKQYKQSVLNSAFEGKLYKTTEWEEKKLKEITTKITDGSHNPPPKQEFGVPMLSGRNIKNGKINFDEYRYITESAFQSEIKRTPIEVGDVLLTIVGTIGESAVVPKNTPKFAIQRSVALLKPQISSFYLKYYLDSPMAFSYYKKNEKGTAQKGIYLETLKNMIIKLPLDKDEQQKIVEEIEKRFKVADNVAKIVEENLEKAEQLKQSILKKAFEGRLVPQDPTDEPASVLIERIKEERNNTK